MKFDYTDSREEALEEVQRENLGLPPKPPTSPAYHQTPAGWTPDNKDDKMPIPKKDIGTENSRK